MEWWRDKRNNGFVSELEVFMGVVRKSGHGQCKMVMTKVIFIKTDCSGPSSGNCDISSMSSSTTNSKTQ